MISRGAAWRFALIALIGIGALLALNYHEELDASALQRAIDGRFAPLVFVAAYAIAAVLFVPGSLFGLAGGALFGPVWGTLWNLTGAVAGAGAAFLIARYLAGDWVTRRAAGRLRVLVSGIETEGWRFVAFVRLVPLFPFNLLNYALGLTRIPFSHYLVTSAAAMLPGTFLYTWVGHAGRETLAGGESMPELIIATLALIATIVFLPRLVRRWRAGRTRWIEPAELRGLLSTPGAATVVDVRSNPEFQAEGAARLPGARNIPLPELPQRIEELVDSKAGKVVLVCLTQRRSIAASEQLLAAGFSNVVVLRGGMESWGRAQSAEPHGVG